MPAKRHDLEDAVRAVIVEHREWGPEKIYGHLVEQIRQLGHSESRLPSPSTIGRIKQRFLESEYDSYRVTRWPDTFDQGILPWSAAAAIVELTQAIQRPPLVRLARWYWRVRQTLPTASVELCKAWATEFALHEDDPERLREGGAALMSGSDYTLSVSFASVDVAEISRGYALSTEEKAALQRSLELLKTIDEGGSDGTQR